MIHVYLQHKDKKLVSFVLKGHADFAESGSDIVCSAVSVLAINTVNSLESLTNAKIRLNIDEKNGGYLELTLKEIKEDLKAQVLMDSFELGIKDIAKSYHKYIKISQ